MERPRALTNGRSLSLGVVSLFFCDVFFGVYVVYGVEAWLTSLQVLEYTLYTDV